MTSEQVKQQYKEKTKAQPLKIALVLLLAVVVLGIIDVGRAAFSAPLSSSDSAPPAVIPHNMMDMMDMRQ